MKNQIHPEALAGAGNLMVVGSNRLQMTTFYTYNKNFQTLKFVLRSTCHIARNVLELLIAVLTSPFANDIFWSLRSDWFTLK